jgi:hypothetical protein
MTDKEIADAINDIAEIRKAVDGNLKILQPLLLNRAFAAFSAITGLAFIALFVVFHFILAANGSFQAIPFTEKALLAISTLLVLLVSAIAKLRIIDRYLKGQRRDLSIRKLYALKEFRNLYILFGYGFLILFSSLSYSCALNGVNWSILLPAFALFVGTFFLACAMAFRFAGYVALSILSVAFGFVSLVAMTGAILLWIAAYIGLICVAYAAMVLAYRAARGKPSGKA